MPRIAVILAGGKSSRMNGRDKATVPFGGERLVDRVGREVEQQADRVLISGPDSYGTNYPSLPDLPGGPAGPAAGLWAAACWMKENFPDAKQFLSVPVDGPFLPKNLYQSLSKPGGCAIAADAAGTHPTFAVWHVITLYNALAGITGGQGISLHALADKCQAKRVLFAGDWQFMNINSAADLTQAEKINATQSAP